MAISRERLEKLIEQEATIYYDNTLYIEKKILTPNKYECDSGYLWGLSHSKHTVGYDLEDLYETKQQAEWHLKYHATRTEELNLPTWEEIEKIKEKGVYIIARPREMIFYIDYKFLIPQIKLCTLEDVFNWNLDEEGYLSACDLCIKLFKGE